MTETTHMTLEDRPARGDRGWRGLAADPGEKVAFAGALGAIALVVVSGLLWGIPAVLAWALLLTVVIFAALLVISVGS